MRSPNNHVVDITVVNDLDNNECLYVRGGAWQPSKGETTVYACDLVDAAKGRLIDLKQVTIEFVHDEWPDLLSDAIDPKFELVGGDNK